MRPVLFEFYIVEIIFGLILLFCLINGTTGRSMDHLPLFSVISNFFYLATIYTFTALAMFESINICTGHSVSSLKELIRTVIGFILHIFISLMSLDDIERDFHLYHSMGEAKLEVEKPVHPVLTYMLTQAFWSLVIGVVYLLHTIIVIDVIMSHERVAHDLENGESTEDGEDVKYLPVRLYVLGSRIQALFERYDWFNDFAQDILRPV